MRQHSPTGRTFKRCTCKHPITGHALGAQCPRLKRRNGNWSSEHGSWAFQAELPRRNDGRRRTVRRGGYHSQSEAQRVLGTIADLLAVGESHGDGALATVADLIDSHLRARKALPSAQDVIRQLETKTTPTGMPTVGEWLHTWITSRKRPRTGTRRAYLAHIRLWLAPYLGHHRLDTLTVEHISQMFESMQEHNEAILAARDSDDPAERDRVRNMRVIRAATMHRYRATLRAALNAAIRDPHLNLTFNAASYVELPSGRRPKALLWTPERVERWEITEEKPSPVMVWTPEQIGRFLDYAEGHPYYVLLHLIAYRGLRRGEACALSWWDANLAHQTVTISAALVQLGWEVEFGEPKSEASGRVVPLDNATTDVLHAQKRAQQQLREAAGEHWTETGLVCTEPDGTHLHPAHLTDAFHSIAKAAGLPPVRLHDLRHGAATLMLAAGADLKLVQDLLGHSSIAITADTYSLILPEVARESAEAAASLVPRHHQQARLAH